MKDIDIVQALSTERPDNAFGVGILPRTPRCGDHFFDIKTAQTPPERLAVDAVVIANQISGGSIEGKGLDYLLRGSLRRQMRSEVEMGDAPAFMGEHDQDKQDLNVHGRHHEEVDRDEFCYKRVGKRLPGRRRRAVRPDPVPLHGRLRHDDAGLCQLADDTRRAQRRISREISRMNSRSSGSMRDRPGRPPSLLRRQWLQKRCFCHSSTVRGWTKRSPLRQPDHRRASQDQSTRSPGSIRKRLGRLRSWMGS